MKKNRFICFLLIAFMAFGLCACVDDEPVVEAKNYNFYFTVSTNPTMYATLDTFQTTDPCSLIFARVGTINDDSLPANAMIIDTEYQSANNENKMDIVAMAAAVKQVVKSNPNAKINFFVDDLNVQYFMDVIVANSANISYENFKLVLLSDGAASYKSLMSELAGLSDDEIIVKYNEAKAQYVELLRHYEDGEIMLGYENGSRTPASYTIDGEEKTAIKSLLHNWAIAQADQGFEVEYLLQFPEFFNTNYPAETYPKFNALINSANTNKYVYSEMFDNLTAEQQAGVMNGALNAAFLSDVRMGYYVDENGNKVSDISTSDRNQNKNTKPFDKAYFDAMIVDGENKALMVLGGSKTAELRYGDTLESSPEFVQTLREIAKRYGSEYKLIWKGHPNHPLTGEIEELALELGFTILPYRLPSTLLMWCYKDLYLGGWSGSSWYDADPAQTLFFTNPPDAVTTSLFKNYLATDENPDGIPVLGNPIPESN